MRALSCSVAASPSLVPVLGLGVGFSWQLGRWGLGAAADGGPAPG